jgi:hypothetical protein
MWEHVMSARSIRLSLSLLVGLALLLAGVVSNIWIGVAGAVMMLVSLIRLTAGRKPRASKPGSRFADPLFVTTGLPRQTAKETAGQPHEQSPSGVLMLGALLGWGPWSAGIGAWEAFGNSGYTISGHSASTSAAHGLCQAGQAGVQPGICGSIDAYYTFGAAMLVIGALAFVGGMIGIFAAQQRNPRAWRQAGRPILAGLIFGIFAVATVVIVAIVRGVREGGTGPSNVQTQPVAAASPQLSPQPSDPPTSARQMNVQWRARAEEGWEWLASDGQWYPQQLAPAGLLPPAPPPPDPGTQAT